MRDIIEKVNNQLAETLFRNDILLSADMTKATHHGRAAIQAVFLSSLGSVAHE
jgi:hypothetical protein